MKAGPAAFEPAGDSLLSAICAICTMRFEMAADVVMTRQSVIKGLGKDTCLPIAAEWS